MLEKMLEVNQPEWFQKLQKVVEGIVSDQSCYLYDLEMVGSGGGRVLRVFIDKDGENGAGIDDCSNVSKGLNQVLDADEGLVPGGPYNLEVSTPGVDRHLKYQWHFEKVKGKKVWLKLKNPLSQFGVQDKGLLNAKKIEEILLDINEREVVLSIKEQEIKIPRAEIEEANLVFDFNTVSKKKN